MTKLIRDASYKWSEQNTFFPALCEVSVYFPRASLVGCNDKYSVQALLLSLISHLTPHSQTCPGSPAISFLFPNCYLTGYTRERRTL